ncbi:MAG: GNAT family N-acetyltransferase [Actinomycetota bacterium]
MVVEIRAARPGEEGALVPTYEWLFAPPGAEPAGWDPADAASALAEAIAAPDSEVFVADAGSELVGICTVYLDLRSVRFGRRAWVEDLAIHPARRSEGLGKRLLDAAKDWARARGATHLELDSGPTRHDAHRFYERERPDSRTNCYGWEL